MEKVKFLKVTKITLSNFRSYGNETVIEVGDMTLVSGDNGKGKSSIAHAISYAFYGVSAFGAQDIDNIRADESESVTVTLEFIDQYGEIHSFRRARTGDDTTLTLDAHKIQQKNVNDLFCDKDTFLSLFNPSYFIEVLGAKGKELLSLRLPVVKKDEVLKSLTDHERQLLNGIDLTAPESVLQDLRRRNKDNSEDLLTTEGQLTQICEDIKNGKQKHDSILTENDELDRKIAALTEKKNTGIDITELTAQKCIIQDNLASGDSNSGKRQKLTDMLSQRESSVFQSPRQTVLAELKAKLTVLSEQFNDISNRIANLKSGETCPSCCTAVTEQNIDAIRQNLKARLNEITNKGKAIKESYSKEMECERQEVTAFNIKREEEINTIKLQLSSLNGCQNPDNRALTNRLNEIDELLRTSNLSEDEFTELCCLEADRKTNDSLIGALDIKAKEAVFKQLTDRKAQLEESVKSNGELIKSVQEYTAKRSEIALSCLKMPNVKIQFYEIVKTTGELKSCFKFTYKGYEYYTLSLSEKIKAGIEVVSMLRGITGFDYPVFIDNSESVGGYDESLLPSQTIFMRFVKDAALTVRKKDIPNTRKSAA